MDAAQLSRCDEILPLSSQDVSAGQYFILGQTDLLGFARQRNRCVWLDCWSRMDGFGRIVVAADRRLVFGDLLAEAFLKDRRGLQLQGSKVEPVDHNLLEDFECLLRVDGGNVNSACLPISRGQSHLIIRATHLEPHTDSNLIAVAFRRADDDQPPQWADLSKVFNLTPAEERVLMNLLHGSAPDEVAKKLQLSITTVRTHISHIYDKLGVTRKEELWSQAQKFRLI